MDGYNKNRHAYFKLTYHLVVVTKYRHRCITTALMERLKEITNNLFEKWGCQLFEMNGEEDHIHILFDAPLKLI